MTTIEKITLIVSLLSLFISIVAAYKSYRLGQHQLRRNTKNQFQPLLIDINRTMIAHPELCAIYDSYLMQMTNSDNPIERARLEAFGLMVLNLFECVFAFYGDSPRLTTSERQSFDAWKAFLRDTLERSSFLRELWDKPNIKLIYNPILVTEIEFISHNAKGELND